MSKKILIDPITRLEGHGKIHIFLDDAGAVDRAFLQIPELRGFEKFVEGRRAEDMPQITSRICGVCPTAHHMAATKALDDLYGVDPPPAAKKIRELVYSIFMVEDHALHFFFLGGPDFVVGPAAPKADRNILGVIGKVGLEIGKEVIGVRKQLRELMGQIAGKPIHPVFGLPGGVSQDAPPRSSRPSSRPRPRTPSSSARSPSACSATSSSRTPRTSSWSPPRPIPTAPTTWGSWTTRTRSRSTTARCRVVDPDGEEFLTFDPQDYLEHIAEHVEPWSYMKFCFLKDVGWKGFAEGPDSGVYGVAPLARLNASDGMATPLAQEAYEELVSTLGGKPVHHTLANHWARIVELVYAAERMSELAADPEILSPDVRTLPTATPDEGIGVVEAPRGTLIHHYRTDERGLITGGKPDRRHAEQRRPNCDVRRQGGPMADHGRRGRRGAPEPARDGLPRVRPLLRLRDAQPSGTDAAHRRDPRSRRRRAPRDPARLMRTLVLGLGNELAADDAVGVLVARRVREHVAGAADVVESSASGMALIEIFAGYERAIVIDSIRTGRNPPGTITELGLEDVGRVIAPSLHHAGLPEMAAVADRLGLQFPVETRVLAVEVLDPYTLGGAPSEPVAAAIDGLARRVRAQIERWDDGLVAVRDY